MREIRTVPLDGTDLVATVHRPGPAAGPAPVAVLVFNAGHVPRDGHGGFWALLGDRLAEEGYPVYRVDFQGFGDTPGELPARIEDFWRRVKRGEYAPLALRLGAWVRQDAGTPGVVMGGLCGAAIHSIFAAERAPGDVAGLLMLEPEFYLLTPNEGQAEGEGEGGERAHGRPQWMSRAVSGWSWLRVLTGAHPLLRPLPLVRRVLLGMYNQMAGLPERTNLELVRAWRRVLDLEVPSLVLTSRDGIWDIYFRKVTEFVVGRHPPDALEHHSVPDTNHPFTRDDAMERAFGLMVPWMRRRFPVGARAVARPRPAVGEPRPARRPEPEGRVGAAPG